MVQTRRRWLSSQVILGALIVLMGVLLLGQTTELYDLGFLFDYVPSLFILLGLYAMVRSGFRNLFGPLVIVAVAGAWQLVALDYVSGDQVWQFWPVFVILFGLSVIVSQIRGRRRASAIGEDHVSALAVFGGSEKRSASTSFSGANLTALFGGTELDLREAEIADPPAHVNAVALFGGVSIIVPGGGTSRWTSCRSSAGPPTIALEQNVTTRVSTSSSRVSRHSVACPSRTDRRPDPVRRHESAGFWPAGRFSGI